MSDALSSWLVNILDERGWSQRELARRAGLSSTTVSQVVSQQRKPTWDFCAQIAHALGVPVDDVFVLAALKRPPSVPVEEEGEILAMLRQLPAAARAAVVTMLQAMAGAPPVYTASEQQASYEVAETELEQEMLETFRGMNDRWQEIFLEEAKTLQRSRLVRFIGEEEQPENETAAANEAA